jgi:hypothetical protein
MPEEPASLILQLLRQMRAELGDVRSDVSQVRSDMATKADLPSLRADVSSDIRSLRADVAADITTCKELSEQITGLRQTVINYQAMALRVCPSLLRLPASAAASNTMESRSAHAPVDQYLNLPSL